MFCRMYEFKMATGLEVIPLTECADECPYYIDGKSCSICSDKEKSLYKNEKFNWNISRTVEFTDSELLEDEDTLVGSVKLLHPTYSPLWILRWVSLTKEGVEEDSYSVFIKNEIKLEDLEKINWYLRRHCKYEGARDLTVNDFKITEESK